MQSHTITDRLHAKADTDLKSKLESSVAWVWDSTGHSTAEPNLEEFPDVSNNFTNDGLQKPTKMPWIGRVLSLFKSVAFAYLRDKWRNQYVADFMGKVEAMASEMENLGIIIESQKQD